ncbi:hypothetical protein [Lewinella sp. JB7]|uniref:hypothetical protein n=1 Tax=Lewinella sp. JB7 TaxID=2962887 RepID=UPI0020C9D5AD|nr:hypothetical protein [Lewinella sp. JB7]MCP9236297.1 hypothetical protein [Lewinella sp. JB7]
MVITTLTLLRYSGFQNRLWALSQMGLAPPKLATVAGLKFYRLMGSGGGNGFAVSPNWGVYALLGHWDGGSAAADFFASHPWFGEVKTRTSERITFHLEATMSHGEWGGDNPFTPRPDRYRAEDPVAVITRATIRPHKLLDFWRYVPRTSASVYEHPARRLSVGIGEYPIFMQATFSIWESGAAMTRFAYHSTHHREVVKFTRERGWYREELFTRFRILGAYGSWQGLDLPAIEQDPGQVEGNVKVGTD